jgi:drug/metabolite transporter (DMT)-like permease
LCAGIFVYSLQDLIIKRIAGDYPIHEAMVIRSLCALPFVGYLVHKAGGLRLLKTKQWKWLAVRGLLQTFSYTAYYLAIPALKLANVVALSFTSPIFITVLAVLFLGEKPRLDRWGAVFVGGVGMLIMIRPSAGDFEIASLLPLFSAIGYAASQIMARRLGVSEPAAVMAFHQNLIFLLMASILAGALHSGIEGLDHPSAQFFVRPWADPGAIDLSLMIACGFIAAVGATCLAQAYRSADASFVTPFEYTALLWGSMWGWTFWGEVPGPETVLGAACIIGSGLYVLWADGRQRGVARPID